MILEKLNANIKPHEIHWRVQSVKNGKTTVVPYLTNRCVMERFDEQFGAEGWQNTFQEWRSKGVRCGISVYINDIQEWVTKYDGADESSIEPTKGGFSDSMKRAAVQWGLGRDLYDYPLIQIKGEHRYLSSEHKNKLAEVSASINNGSFNREYVLIDTNDHGKASQQPTPMAKPIQAKPQKKVVEKDSPQFLQLVKWIAEGEGTIEKAKASYSISEDVENELKEKIQALEPIIS